MYMWVSTLFNMPKSSRRKLRNAVLEGMKYYNAKWKPSKQSSVANFTENIKGLSLQEFLEGPHPHKVSKFDPEVLKFAKNLENEKGFKFIGFSDVITYIKESGSQDQMEALWEHPLGSPALLYKVEGLPALIIAGPDLDLDDSIRNRIPANSHRKQKTYGVTG